MSDDERFFSGAELFDDDCRVSLAGLKALYPGWTSTALRNELKRLLEVTERLSQ